MRTPAQQAKARRDCFDMHKYVDDAGHIYLVCHICGGRINPAREKWEADHRIRRSLRDDDTPLNVWPAHTACHREKTSVDVIENAKGKRASDKHFGISRKGWGGKWRKKLNGETVER